MKPPFKCPECNSNRTKLFWTKRSIQWFKCKDCNYGVSADYIQGIKEKKPFIVQGEAIRFDHEKFPKGNPHHSAFTSCQALRLNYLIFICSLVNLVNLL